jgi:hypothetical protein
MIAELEALRLQLYGSDVEASIKQLPGPGDRARLHVRSRRESALETIRVAGGWFVWSWDEPIAPVEDVAGAAREITRVLQVVDTGGMRDQYRLGAALQARNVVALPTGTTIRVWISGHSSGWIEVFPVAGKAPLWAWRSEHDGGSHPRADTDGAAEAIAAFLRRTIP